MKHIIDTDELALQLARKIMQEVNTHTIPSDVQRMPQLQAKIQVLISETIANSPQADDVRKDAERWRFVTGENGYCVCKYYDSPYGEGYVPVDVEAIDKARE